jgi:hypothetical protein
VPDRPRERGTGGLPAAGLARRSGGPAVRPNRSSSSTARPGERPWAGRPVPHLTVRSRRPRALCLGGQAQDPFLHLLGGPRGFDLARRDKATIRRWRRRAGHVRPLPQHPHHRRAQPHHLVTAHAGAGQEHRPRDVQARLALLLCLMANCLAPATHPPLRLLQQVPGEPEAGSPVRDRHRLQPSRGDPPQRRTRVGSLGRGASQSRRRRAEVRPHGEVPAIWDSATNYPDRTASKATPGHVIAAGAGR